jgi:hypothetical protein
MEEKWLFFFRNAFEFLALIEYRSIYIYSEWEEKRDCVCVCSKEVTFSISKAEIEFCLGERQTAHQKKKKTFWALVRLVLTVSQANDIPFILYIRSIMIRYKKADVISTLGSHNTLIPRHGIPSKVIFRTLRILMSMMIDLFIHQWREIFIWTMPSDQTTPRSQPIFKFFLWLDTIKAVTS